MHYTKVWTSEPKTSKPVLLQQAENGVQTNQRYVVKQKLEKWVKQQHNQKSQNRFYYHKNLIVIHANVSYTYKQQWVKKPK